MAEKEFRDDKNLPPSDDKSIPTISADDNLASPPEKKKPKIDDASSLNAQMKLLSPRDLVVPASPPKFISLDDIMRMANGVNDMSLAHEIAVDRDFQIQPKKIPDNSLESRVKEIMHKAFWDILEEQLKEDPPDYSQALVLLREVKETLCELFLPQNQRLRERIDDVLDLELIEQKSEHGVLDISYYANFVIDMMAMMCAPVRDEEIAQLRLLSDILPIYKEILRVLDLMKLDMVNFTIDAARPYIQKHSVEYEKQKFKTLLETQRENGIDGLQFTKSWLSRNAEKLQNKDEKVTSPEVGAGASDAAGAGGGASDAAGAGAGGGGVGGRKLRYIEIMNLAYLELLEWDDEHQVYPETLLIDEKRFVGIRDRVGWLTLISSILIVIYNTVGQSISGITQLKEKLKTQIEILTEEATQGQLPEVMANVAEQVTKEVNQCLTEHDFQRMTGDQEKLLKGQIMAIITPNNSIFKLMKSRLFAFISSVIANPKCKDLQIPSGFSIVSKEISSVCSQFLRLIGYNQAVFGSHYEDIITSLLRTPQQGTR